VTLTRTETRGFGVSVVATALVLGGTLGAAAMWMLASGRTSKGPQPVAEGNSPSPSTTVPAQTSLDQPRDVTEAVITPARDEVAPATPRAAAARDVAPAGQIDAALLVHSTPSGAVVTVDGVTRGTTPVAVRGLALGTRVVVVSRPGYREVARQVVLTNQRPSRTLEIDLAPVPRQSAAAPARATREGSVVIESRPTGATVFVDGKRAGVTPLTLILPVGEHDVRLEHAGHRAVTTKVDVKASERARVAARLEGGQEQE
jgi:hypothetical protein